VGYVAAGRQAGDGDDGIAAGFGAEFLSTAMSDNRRPCARAKVDRVLHQTSDMPSGDLHEISYMVSGGLRFGRSIEVHINYGSNYSGDVSLGFGIALGLNL